MRNMFFGSKILVVIFICSFPVINCGVGSGDEKYVYKTKFLDVPLDNFNFAINKTFKLRYLYNDTFRNNSTSPLFFYTGNEGDIELFAKNTGFMWKLAAQYEAVVVFAEHRYYGKSLPFGDSSLNNTEHIGYLSVEQTLEDYAKLIDYLKNGKQIPVIAFGGSYGGMLAVWLRMKFPHLVYGALASSAPIWQFNGLTSCDIYSKIITSVFTTSYSPNCSENIRLSWNMFKNFSATEEGKKQLNELFKFCEPLKDQENVNQFLDFLEDVYGNLAMANYPYYNEFLSPLPAYPVRQFCFYLKDLHDGMDLLNSMQKAIGVYANYTGKSTCLNYKSAYEPSIGGNAWDIQTCNEMVMPMCSYLNETMFRNKEWNFKTYSDNCFNRFKIRPKLNDVILRYGGKNLHSASNIIFSNGLLDPWSGGGVLQSVNSKIMVIVIPEGAHHIDLREENSSDPPSVTEARKQESKLIGQWITEFFSNNK